MHYFPIIEISKIENAMKSKIKSASIFPENPNEGPSTPIIPKSSSISKQKSSKKFENNFGKKFPCAPSELAASNPHSTGTVEIAIVSETCVDQSRILKSIKSTDAEKVIATACGNMCVK